MRPRGTVRSAVQAHLQAALDGVTWFDLALLLEAQGLVNSKAPGELRLVRAAVKNMVKTGEAEPLRDVRRSWSRRPLKLYGARRQAEASEDAGDLLAGAMRSWGSQA